MLSNQEKSIVHSFAVKEIQNFNIAKYFYKYINEFIEGNCDLDDIYTLAEAEIIEQFCLLRDKTRTLLCDKRLNKFKRLEYLNELLNELKENDNH